MRLFLDVLLNMLLALCFVVLILFMMVHPPKQEEAAKQPGNIAVTACWNEGPIDIDLWGHAPGDEKPVGFSNRSSKTLNLLRDDLGNANDSMPVNCENIFSRGSPDGEYVFNLHAYKSPVYPVTVRVEIRILNTRSEVVNSMESTVELVREGQEATAVRFRLEKGSVIVSSVNKVFKPIRNAKK